MKRDDGTTYIRATIYCERDSQRALLLVKRCFVKQLAAGSVQILKTISYKSLLRPLRKVKKD